MSFWCETTQRSRKVRNCEECQKDIMIGDVYVRGVGINVYGEFGVWITHPDCLEATREQRQLGGLMNDEWWPLHEWVHELPPSELKVFAEKYPAAYARVEFSMR